MSASMHYKISKSLNQAKSELNTTLSQKIKKDYVKVEWRGDDLLVSIDKGGKSEFHISLKPEGDTVSLKEVKRNIAFLHKPFVSEVERMIDDIIGSIGGKRV
jgi:hypothetical protein